MKLPPASVSVATGEKVAGSVASVITPTASADPDWAMRQLKRASQMGIHIASGSDSGAVGVPHGPGTIREYELLAEAGISRDRIEESNAMLKSRFAPKCNR